MRCSIPLKTKKKKRKLLLFKKFGTLMGNRTPDSAVRGRRLNRLTMRAQLKNKEIITKEKQKNKCFYNLFFIDFVQVNFQNSCLLFY